MPFTKKLTLLLLGTFVMVARILAVEEADVKGSVVGKVIITLGCAGMRTFSKIMTV